MVPPALPWPCQVLFSGAPPPHTHTTQATHHTDAHARLTGDCEGVRGAMPQLSWVLGEPGGLGMGDRSGLDPAKRGEVIVAQSG